MIIRIFRVTIAPELREDFERDFNSISVGAVKGRRGLLSWRIVGPTRWNPDEYAMITEWEDEQALESFAGVPWNQALIPPPMSHYVRECRTDHFQAETAPALKHPTTLHLVDAFTRTPFEGNPAAVCVLEGPRDEAWMQKVAREMHLSETAFLFQREDDTWSLRWFTPAVEVALCGHATLASAHVLWQTGAVGPEEIARFQTQSGILTARKRDALIELDFPAHIAQPCEEPEGLAEALGSPLRWCGRSRFDILVEVADEATLRALSPNFSELKKLPVRGVIVTSPSASPEFDFVSRFFAPAAGIDEDPVTGSAHCTLGPYWSAKLGRDELTAFQASARGGTVKVSVRGERVLLGGHAVITGQVAFRF